MAFEGLADKLGNAFKRLKSKGKLSEADVKEAMREVRLALLEADVNYKVAKDFTKSVTDRAIGAAVMESLTPAQMVIKIVNEELTSLMGGASERLNFPSKPPAVTPSTGDTIMPFVIVMIVALVALVVVALFSRKVFKKS